MADAMFRASLKAIRTAQERARKPLAIILAGHNGSGKSTLWYEVLAGDLQIPLINADRMMLSILPEPSTVSRRLPDWAQKFRDKDQEWMRVVQAGVQAFVQVAKQHRVPFAMETVFSHWKPNARTGKIESKIDLIRDLQKGGYFVLLIFVGLSSVGLSIGRVLTRKIRGGHDVPLRRLVERFPRTQKAIKSAIPVADAALLVDNSGSKSSAFKVCLVRVKNKDLFDVRKRQTKVPLGIESWLNKVRP